MSFLLMTSCQSQENQSSTAKLATDPLEQKRSYCRASRTDPFRCVEIQCEETGGTFNHFDQSCSCPEYRGFYATFVGLEESSCLAYQMELIQGEEQIYFFDQRFQHNKSMNFSLKWKSNDDFNVDNFVQLRAPFPTSSVNVEYLAFDDIDDITEKEVRLLLKDDELPIHQAYPNPRKRIILPALIGRDGIAFRRGYPQGRGKNLIPEVAMQTKAEIDFLTTRGCLDGCRFTKTWQQRGLNYRLVKSYYSGFLLKHTLIVSEEKKPASWDLYYLDHQGRQILHFDLSFRESNELELKYKVSSPGSKIKKGTISLLESFNGAFDLKRYLPESAYGEPVVVMCDSGVSPAVLWQKDLLERTLKSDGPGFYGLGQSNPIWGQYQGLFHFSEYGFPQYLNSHHSEILMSEMNDVFFIPLDFETCLNSKTWFQKAKEERTKVVNFSGGFHRGFGSCETNLQLASNIRETENEMLWLVSAGNEGLDEEEQMIALCPQGIIKNQKNGLVIGSIGGLRNQSNQGRDYVDFFVEADSTSKATAILSNSIARLVNDLDLTPIQIKSLLYHSIERSSWQSRSSKAEGNYEEDRFKKTLEVYQDLVRSGESFTSQDILEALYCEDWGCYRRKIKKKIKEQLQNLKENQMIWEDLS